MYFHTIWKHPIRSLRTLLDRRSPQISPTTPQTSSTPTATSWKEFYFCVDKLWTSIKQTSLRTISVTTELNDDYELFINIKKSLSSERRSWVTRVCSWKSYTRVCLSKASLDLSIGLNPSNLLVVYVSFRQQRLGESDNRLT